MEGKYCVWGERVVSYPILNGGKLLCGLVVPHIKVGELLCGVMCDPLLGGGGATA